MRVVTKVDEPQDIFRQQRASQTRDNLQQVFAKQSRPEKDNASDGFIHGSHIFQHGEICVQLVKNLIV